MNVVSSEATRSSRRPGVAALGLRFLAGARLYDTPSPPAQIFTGEW
jgi:hypothetical protein